MLAYSSENLKRLEVVLDQLTSTSHGRRAFLAALPVLLAACAGKSRHREREGDNTGQNTQLTVQDEQRMTQEYLPKISKEYPLIENSELQTYIQGLGNRLVISNNLNGNPYHYSFSVVGASFVNAFALPAGTVYITAPLLAMAESEAELAGVVGHEIGHIQARHTAERMDAAEKQKNKGWLYSVGGGLLGAAAGFGLGKALCKSQDSACVARAAALGAAAGVAGGLLVQKFAFMANSREDEMEADRIGFKRSVTANYSRDHVGLFYNKLQKMEEAHSKNKTPLLSSVTDALATHPPSQERVSQMQTMVAETPRQPNPIVSTKAFDRAKQLAQAWVKTNPPKAT